MKPKRPSFSRKLFQKSIAWVSRNLIRRHAPNNELPKEKTFKEKLLHNDYFYNHAEPHRRRPTLVTFPRFITHTATFFGAPDKPLADTPRTSFRKWLSTFEEADVWKMRKDSDSEDDQYPWKKATPVQPDDLWRFSRIAQPSLEELEEERRLNRLQEESARSRDTEYFLEFIHRDEPKIVVRIEAHSEFFTLTLFKPLPDKFDVATVYQDYKPKFVPSDEPDPQNPFHALYAGLVKRFPESTFAHFKGVVVGPKAFHSTASYPAAPAFPRAGDSGPMDPDVAASTAMFLRGQKEAFKKGLFAASDEDVVACYFQRGQVIYVSALGAQEKVESKDELRYLLIYNEAPIKRGVRLGLARWKKPGRTYNRFADRYRLSRLVHRVNTIGTLRLAAIRDLRKLRRAGDELRRIETSIEIAANDESPRSRVHKLRRMIERLERMAREYAAEGAPLFYRTARAGLYFDQMKKLLEDLGADSIPEWQSYNQFLSRRLFTQHEFTATLGNRFSELWTLARSRAEVAEALALGWLKLAAEIGSMILLPLAVADFTRKHTYVRTIGGAIYDAVTGWLASVVFDVRPHVIHALNWVDPEQWWQQPDIQEFWFVYALTFCVWLVFILCVRHRRERPLTAKRP